MNSPTDNARQSIKHANISGYAAEAEQYEQTADAAVEAARVAALMGPDDRNHKRLTIVEIGGGTGHGTEVIRHLRRGATHVVSDISLDMLLVCRRRLSDVMLVVCDAEHMPFRDSASDLVVCASFLHHLPDDRAICAEVRRVLRDGGAFVGIREPNRTGADRFFRMKHLGRRYATSSGVKDLARRLLAGPRGWRQIYSYEGISAEEFERLDRQEVRGAILHPTPTKQRGGIDPREFARIAGEYYAEAMVRPFGMLAVCVEAAQYWVGGKREGTRGLRIARWLDARLARLASRLPFDSFGFCCRK